MRAIGGYFELELNNFNNIYHNNAIAVNSARNALEYILKSKKYTKIYIPYYICDVILEPLKKLKLEYEFYHINDKFIPIIHKIKKNEAVLYVNYFGIMNENIKKIYSLFDNLIIDNTQAFFDMPYKKLPTFYSPRKFFGIPDGGFLYLNKKTKNIQLEIDTSFDKTSHLLLRLDNNLELGYLHFKENSKKIKNLPLKKMSKLTKALLNNINFKEAKLKREKNFHFLHKYLKSNNSLTKLIENSNFTAPMVYPFLKENNQKLKERLINNKIFVASYWPNIPSWLNNNKKFENYLYQNLIPLPIDQRYSKKEMVRILEVINL